jgi:hypothetical protein
LSRIAGEHSPPLRAAFSLVFSLAVLIVVSGMLAIAMKFASGSSRYIADSYVRELGELKLSSAIEKTLLAISAHDRGADRMHWNCYERYEESTEDSNRIQYSIFIEVKRYYLHNASCDNVESIVVPSEKSHGFVLLEAEMNASRDGLLLSRILKRTLQHP